ncbi:hypothetical protein, partial [Porphyromonas loveana]|uniref:hypothetical protein n=1 Tax=Porphyromonas loveana TaxID=1884669 RepID=UPI00359FC1C8
YMRLCAEKRSPAVPKIVAHNFFGNGAISKKIMRQIKKLLARLCVEIRRMFSVFFGVRNLPIGLGHRGKTDCSIVSPAIRLPTKGGKRYENRG